MNITCPNLISENYKKNFIEIDDLGDKTVFSELKKNNSKVFVSILKKLIKILPEILNKNGIAFIEIDPSQSNYFRSLDYFICEIKKDFNNLDRMVTLKFK